MLCVIIHKDPGVAAKPRFREILFTVKRIEICSIIAGKYLPCQITLNSKREPKKENVFPVRYKGNMSTDVIHRTLIIQMTQNTMDSPTPYLLTKLFLQLTQELIAVGT